mgnify:CR=1 FL=1|tara:strand:+ start:52204 stop:52689 length:486 start_codon:yes stop_codon:yes gene_type:complete
MPKLKYKPSRGLYQESGSGIELGGNNMSGGLKAVRSITSADSSAGVTLSAADSGIIVSLVSAAGNVAIVLPSAETAGAGWHCDICYAATSLGGNVIATTSPASTFKVIQVDGGTSTNAPDSGTTLSMAGGGTAGDMARVWCDGTFYYVMASATAAGIITAS